MTIFRRRSHNLANEAPVLEASASDSKLLLLGDHGHNEMVDDSSSMVTNFSNSSSDLEDENEISLSRAFSDFSIKLDGADDNVMVSVDIPPAIPVDDLAVNVDNGILLVSGDVSGEADTAKTVEQAFQLDEQSLDIQKVTANLTDGVLTITAPLKDAEDATLLDSLPIQRKQPPRVDNDTFQLIVDLPGVQPEDIHLSYANGKLRVAGSRHFGRARSFKRSIDVDTQKFDADLLQTYLYEGRLTVIIPHKEESHFRSIKIETDEE